MWRDIIDITIWGFTQRRYCICLWGRRIKKYLQVYLWYWKKRVSASIPRGLVSHSFQQTAPQLHKSRVVPWESFQQGFQGIGVDGNKARGKEESLNREGWEGKGWEHWTCFPTKKCQPPLRLFSSSSSSSSLVPHYWVLIKCLVLY